LCQYVLSGVGLVQREGEPGQKVRSDDAVWFAPGELHWHGATPDYI
jgi:quercetin dioxygenase-like cupin family protein